MIPMVQFRRFGLDQFLSMPYGSHGGPVVAGDADPQTASALAQGFHSLGTGLRTMRFEMSVFRPSSSLETALSRTLGKYFNDFRTHIVDLTPGVEVVWNSYRHGTRKCVRTAERAGVSVAVEDGREPLEILYRFHLAQSRVWKGIHPHSLEALRAIIEVFGPEAKIYVARQDGRPLAACLFLYHRGREVHAWASGAVPEARPARAFHFLIHTAIQDACRERFEVWHFGGSGGNQRVEFFKESFAAKAFPVHRYFHMPGWARRLRRKAAWDE